MVSVGPSGTGKTFITTQLLGGLSPDKYINNIINFSARTSVNYTQGRSDGCTVFQIQRTYCLDLSVN